MSVRAAVPGLAAGERTLAREASAYLCRVLRLREGDGFIAFDPAALVEADAVLVRASGEAAVVAVGALRPAAVVALAPLALVYGLAKGDKVDAVVRDATELGATHVLVARATRSVAKAAGERAEGKVARWRRIAEQAARQCGRADPPRVEGVLSWTEALDAAAEAVAGGAAAGAAAARYCLWEDATEPLGPALVRDVARGAALAFAIGPEGGLTRDEVDAARARDFATASLGRFILRTETAPAAVLGAVRVLQG